MIGLLQLCCGFSNLTGLLADEAAPKGRKSPFSCGRDRGGRHRNRLGTAGALVICLLAVMPFGISGADEPVYDIDIPSMNAAEALNRLAEQTGAVMLFSYDLAGAKRANGVRGRYTLLEGLELLLRDTGLSGGLSDKRVVIIAEEGSMKGENGKKRGWFAGLVAALAATVAVDGKADQARETATASAKLEEVIVTAQKREERLIDVPISIVVVGADELQQRGITSLNDLQFAVPGMSIFDTGLARQIQVRGVANVNGPTSLVGVYLDEAAVTLAGAQQMNPSTYDLERVEVLRGPQGTLYGEGSAGGTVRFITKSPELDRFGMTADAAALFTEDGAPGQRFNAMLNVPLIENELGLRFAGTFNREGGWIDQPAADRKDINGQDLTNVRVKALWKPSPQFTLNAMAQIYRNDRSQGVGEDAIGNYTQTFNLTTTPRVVQDHNIYNLTLTYDFQAVRVLSATSYIEATNENENFGNIFPAFEPPAAPLDYVSDWLFDSHVLVEELRLTSSGSGPWQWTAGGYYRHYRFESDQPVGYFAQPGPPGTPLPVAFDIKSTNVFDSWSAFGDVSYRLTDRLTLGAGVRYFQDDQEAASAFAFGAPAVLGPEQTGSFDSVDPRFYAQYKLTNDINVYTSAAKGFRSGGFNAADLPRFDPESVWTYELGTKMSLLEGRLRTDMAVFYSNYTDYVIFGIPEIGGLNIEFSNAGDARIIGIEWDLEWQPADQWTLGFNGDYLDTEFTKINATSTAFIEGDPLNFIPEYQFTVSAQRDFNWNGRPGFMRLDYSQQGPITLRDRSIGPWFFSESDVIGLLNYDMRLQWTENLSLNLFMQNLLNERGFMSADSLEGLAARPRPRTYGISFGVSF